MKTFIAEIKLQKLKYSILLYNVKFYACYNLVLLKVIQYTRVKI